MPAPYSPHPPPPHPPLPRPAGATASWPSPARSAGRRPVITRWLLTAALTLHGLVALAQPVLIGGYLDGHFDLVQVHGINGSLLMLTAFVAAVAAVAYWVAGGRGWPTVVLAGLWFAEFVQLVLGYTRVLSVHVVLGVLIVGSALALAAWGWTRAAGRGRQGWWR